MMKTKNEIMLKIDELAAKQEEMRGSTVFADDAINAQMLLLEWVIGVEPMETVEEEVANA